jgi:glyoxalase family protein
MERTIPGIHHVTAIAGDPQRNVDFYAGALGLRLVKRTVNFDDPGTYHLYYGDEAGHPGTIMTFFPWPGAPSGRRGTGQVAVTAFTIPEGAAGYWKARLAQRGIAVEGPLTRFDEQVLAVEDPDGLPLELIACPEVDTRPPWREGPVPVEHASRAACSSRSPPIRPASPLTSRWISSVPT